MWCYQVLPLEHLARSAFELHAVTVTLPIKLFLLVIYRPPGPLRDFYDEMDALLSCFPENGTPLVILGDIKPEKLHSPELTNFFFTFDLTLSPTPPTHKADAQSRQYSSDEHTADPEPILPSTCLFTTLVWEIEATVTR